MLYKLLTGIVPFPGDSVAARVYGHLNGTAPPPSTIVRTLPSGFDDVIAKALAKEPADRYPTCRALAVAARAALNSPVRAASEYPVPVAATPRPVQPMPQWLGQPPGTRPELVPAQQYREQQPPPAPHREPARQEAAAVRSRSQTPLLIAIAVAVLLLAALAVVLLTR